VSESDAERDGVPGLLGVFDGDAPAESVVDGEPLVDGGAVPGR
jgi:hypothetical protein